MENEEKNNPQQDMEQGMNSKNKTDLQQEFNNQEATGDMVELAQNGRRIHEDEIIQILTKMSLATRSIIWELNPEDIKYLDTVIKKEIDGKKIITKTELRRELLRELYKEGNEKNGNEIT